MSAWDKIFDVGLAAGVLGLVALGIKSAISNKQAAMEDEKRKLTPMVFPDSLPEDCFEALARVTAKQVKGRKITIDVVGPVVFGIVQSKSGLSTWTFTIDFNDYGSLTGRYWLTSNNEDSEIPKYIADNIQREVRRYI